MGKVFALLVGIDRYPEVKPLSGCRADVERVRGLLGDLVAPADLAIETLTEGEATRANIMQQIRSHLGQAGPGDAAYFHFAGHGAQAGSAPEFKPWFASGLDEGLLCWDTNLRNGLLLNDKDLAVLISDLAPRGAQITVTLDCCNSGSGTRDVGGLDDLAERTIGVFDGRRPELASYADGYYARLLAQGLPLTIPEGRHILLAACDRTQTAKEGASGGIFTTALVDALRASGTAISYADLFRRCRAAARESVGRIMASNPRVTPQDPQFQPAAGFDVGSGFLGRSLGDHRPRYFVAPANGGWRVECGAIHGLPLDSASPVTFNLFRPAAPDVPAGTATATRVLPATSEIVPAFPTSEDRAYLAEITSLPVAPLLVGFSGDAALKAAIAAALKDHAAAPVELVDDPALSDYQLVGQADRLALMSGERLIQWVDAASPDAATALIPALGTVARWERLRRLDNPRSALDRGAIELILAVDDAPAKTDGLGVLALDFAGSDRFVTMSARNGTDRPWLHILLVYFANDFAIRVKRAEPIPGRSASRPEGGTQLLYQSLKCYLNEDEAAGDIAFKLLASTAEPDGFLLEQDGLAIGEAVVTARAVADFDAPPPPPKVLSDDWLTKDLVIRLTRTPGP